MVLYSYFSQILKTIRMENDKRVLDSETLLHKNSILTICLANGMCLGKREIFSIFRG